MKEAIKSKARSLRAGVLLLQDNAPILTVQVAVAEAANFGFELLPYSPYSLDLAPSDFFLFPKLKSYLYGHHFKNNEVICTAERVFELIEFQCLSSIIKPRALNSRGTILKNRKKLSCKLLV